MKDKFVVVFKEGWNEEWDERFVVWGLPTVKYMVSGVF